LSYLQRLNEDHLSQRPGETDLAARIASYQLAAKMQTAAKEALDISQETAATHRLYGIDQPDTKVWGQRCLIARRLVERGVRFVQIPCGNQHWDHHGGIEKALPLRCKQSDRPTAALVKDLRQRGPLDTTLVHWGGEMGRLPIAQLPRDKDPNKAGRDHNKNAICTWLAGGGVKSGFVLGATDDLGFAAVEDRVSVAAVSCDRSRASVAAICMRAASSYDEIRAASCGRSGRRL